jgi:hypothetical protein
MQIDLPVPDHTTLSVRGKGLSVTLPKKKSSSLHIVVDSTGLKIYGEGEWKTRKHGISKRRIWLKLHLAVDPHDGQIEAVVLSEAGLSDADAVEPMLAQIDQEMESFGADGAYDKRKVYQKVRNHSLDCQVNVPPQKMLASGNMVTAKHLHIRAMRIYATFASMVVVPGRRIPIIINVPWRKPPCFE